MKLERAIPMAALFVLLLAGCGGSSSRPAANAGTSAGTTTNASQPGCSSFCQQAGATGGDEGEKLAREVLPGCGESAEESCLKLGGATTVQSGVFRMEASCRSTSRCTGALVLYRSDNIGASGRLGGSDFDVAPQNTASVAIALTTAGDEFVRQHERYHALTWVWLKGPDDSPLLDSAGDVDLDASQAAEGEGEEEEEG
jgi:hypothetical protein